MLTIYGRYKSRATRTIWLAYELDIPFKLVPVLQKGRLADPLAADAPLNTASPDYLAISQFGLIPCVDDDGLVLHESLAINLHLARKHGGDLAPRDAAEDALMSMWSFHAASSVEPYSVEISLVYGGGRQDTEAGAETVARSAAALQRPFATLEQHLSAAPFLVGDRFTVADLNVAECVRYAEGPSTLLPAFPALSAWLKRCQGRTAFQRMWAERGAE